MARSEPYEPFSTTLPAAVKSALQQAAKRTGQQQNALLQSLIETLEQWKVVSVWCFTEEPPTSESVLFRFHGDRLSPDEATTRQWSLLKGLQGQSGLVSVMAMRQTEEPTWISPSEFAGMEADAD